MIKTIRVKTIRVKKGKWQSLHVTMTDTQYLVRLYSNALASNKVDDTQIIERKVLNNNQSKLTLY